MEYLKTISAETNSRLASHHCNTCTQSCAAMAWTEIERESKSKSKREKRDGRREHETPNRKTTITTGKTCGVKKGPEASGNGGQTGKRQRRKTALRVPIRHGAPSAPARHLMTIPGADTEWWCPNHRPQLGNPPGVTPPKGWVRLPAGSARPPPAILETSVRPQTQQTRGKQKRLKEKHQTPRRPASKKQDQRPENTAGHESRENPKSARRQKTHPRQTARRRRTRGEKGGNKNDTAAKGQNSNRKGNNQDVQEGVCV